MHSFASFIIALDILCGPVPLPSHLDTIQFLICDPFLSFVYSYCNILVRGLVVVFYLFIYVF